MPNPLVSAVIVNWNGAHHLRIALPSLRQQTYAPLEILVVDNGSLDDSEQVTRAEGVVWIGLSRNIGLAPACNEGARRARGDYLVFLNNDMRFAADFIERLVGPLRDEARFFAADAMQFDWDGTKEVHWATRVKRRSLVESYTKPGLLPLVDIVQEAVSQTEFAVQGCAAAMAVRRSMFDDLGGFDERLPVSWEDTEISWRSWLRDWPTVFVPQAVCWHRVGASVSESRRGAAARSKGAVGGRLLFATKHLPVFIALNTWFISLLGVVKDLLRGRVGDARFKAGVIVEYASFIPSLIAERRHLYKQGSTTPRSHLERLSLLKAVRSRSKSQGQSESLPSAFSSHG